MKELEQKVLISPQEFARCRETLQRHTRTAGDRYVQVNYYFDTPDFSLSTAHCMLRVRRKKNTLYLQFKTKRIRKDSLFLCDESEAELNEFPKTVNPSRYFPEAPDTECFLLGDLVTDRTDFVFPGGVVSLDENVYLGRTDYEVEIEGDPDAIERISAFLNPKGSSDQGNGKFSRFLHTYQAYVSGGEGEKV